MSLSSKNNEGTKLQFTPPKEYTDFKKKLESNEPIGTAPNNNEEKKEEPNKTCSSVRAPFPMQGMSSEEVKKVLFDLCVLNGSDQDDTDQDVPLKYVMRINRQSDGFLICFHNGSEVEVTIRQKRERITFGSQNEVQEHPEQKDSRTSEKITNSHSGDVNDRINWVLLASKLLENGRNQGFIKSRDFPQIPELIVRSESVCKKILQDELAYEEKHGGEENLVLSVYTWAAYAGMGAVYLWNKDWNKLSKNGIYESLTKERGFYAMDEYVFDTIGIPFGSQECKQLTLFFVEQISVCASFISSEQKHPDRTDFLDGAKAMFALGMVYEMNRLGMM